MTTNLNLMQHFIDWLKVNEDTVVEYWMNMYDGKISAEYIKLEVSMGPTTHTHQLSLYHGRHLEFEAYENGLMIDNVNDKSIKGEIYTLFKSYREIAKHRLVNDYKLITKDDKKSIK